MSKRSDLEDLFTDITLDERKKKKKTIDEELGELLKVIEITDPEEEYDLLKMSAMSEWNKNDVMWVLKVAEDRYKRYKIRIDLSNYVDVLTNINKFLEMDWKSNPEIAWKLMKKIDNRLVDEIDKQGKNE